MKTAHKISLPGVAVEVWLHASLSSGRLFGIMACPTSAIQPRPYDHEFRAESCYFSPSLPRMDCHNTLLEIGLRSLETSLSWRRAKFLRRRKFTFFRLGALLHKKPLRQLGLVIRRYASLSVWRESLSGIGATAVARRVYCVACQAREASSGICRHLGAAKRRN